MDAVQTESVTINNAFILNNWTKTKSPTEMVKLTFTELNSLNECKNLSKKEKTVLFFSLVQIATLNNIQPENDMWQNAIYECATNHNMDGQKLSELTSFDNIMKYDEFNKLSALAISTSIQMLQIFSENGVPVHMLESDV